MFYGLEKEAKAKKRRAAAKKAARTRKRRRAKDSDLDRVLEPLFNAAEAALENGDKAAAGRKFAEALRTAEKVNDMPAINEARAGMRLATVHDNATTLRKDGDSVRLPEGRLTLRDGRVCALPSNAKFPEKRFFGDTEALAYLKTCAVANKATDCVYF
jgi:hypothetical protein